MRTLSAFPSVVHLPRSRVFLGSPCFSRYGAATAPLNKYFPYPSNVAANERVEVLTAIFLLLKRPNLEIADNIVDVLIEEKIYTFCEV